MPFICSRIAYPFMAALPRSCVGVEARQGAGQFLVGHTAGPVVERLAVAAFGLVTAHGAQQGGGDLVDGAVPDWNAANAGEDASGLTSPSRTATCTKLTPSSSRNVA